MTFGGENIAILKGNPHFSNSGSQEINIFSDTLDLSLVYMQFTYINVYVLTLIYLIFQILFPFAKLDEIHVFNF